MDGEMLFLVEKSMGLFWVLVQQACFCCVKYVYAGIVSGGGTAAFVRQRRRIAAVQIAAAASLVVLCFERELGVGGLSRLLDLDAADFYPWAVRMALCAAMILFDALLLLYTFRIYRIYRHGLSAARPTLPADAALTAGVLALWALYEAGGIHAALSRGLTIDDYVWIGRAFIQISNFFYVPLEICGASLMYIFWRSVRDSKRTGGADDD